MIPPKQMFIDSLTLNLIELRYNAASAPFKHGLMFGQLGILMRCNVITVDEYMNLCDLTDNAFQHANRSITK